MFVRHRVMIMQRSHGVDTLLLGYSQAFIISAGISQGSMVLRGIQG